MILLLTILAIPTMILYGLAMIWQDDLQREQIRIELDNRYGDRV
jgi:hypothetical protein